MTPDEIVTINAVMSRRRAAAGTLVTSGGGSADAPAPTATLAPAAAAAAAAPAPAPAPLPLPSPPRLHRARRPLRSSPVRLRRRRRAKGCFAAGRRTGAALDGMSGHQASSAHHVLKLRGLLTRPRMTS